MTFDVPEKLEGVVLTDMHPSRWGAKVGTWKSIFYFGVGFFLIKIEIIVARYISICGQTIASNFSLLCSNLLVQLCIVKKY